MFVVTSSTASYRTPILARRGLSISAGRLAAIRGFPFPVWASPPERGTAKRIARRALAARDLLHSALGVAPRLSLRVLSRDDWGRYAECPAYGVTHVSHDGDLVVGAGVADAWHDVSDHFARHLPAPALATLVGVHGLDPVNRRGPALGALAESLIAHEVAHLLAAQEGVAFRRRWLEEAFANYALVAVLADTDPAGLRLVGSLAEAAAALDAGMPGLTDFERDFGQLDVVASVLAELAITRAVYSAYAAQHTAPLARLFALFSRGCPARDADYEFGRMLAARVHPSIAAIPSRFASRRIGVAA